MKIWILLITLLIAATISEAQTTNLALSNKGIAPFITGNLPAMLGFVSGGQPKTIPSKPINLAKRKQATLSFFICLCIFLGYLNRKEKRIARLTTDAPLFFTPKNG